MRRLVGQAEEDDVEPVDPVGVEALEHEVGVGHGQARVELGRRRAGLAVAGGAHDVEIGCWAQQPQQLGARVARRPDDPDADHRRMIIHTAA